MPHPVRFVPTTLAAQSTTCARALLVLLCLSLLTACGRQFAVSVNQQTLYDPRPGSAIIRVPDAGLQSCINLALRQLDSTDLSQIRVLSCPNLDIENLSGLAALRELRFLDIANNAVSTLDELRYLTRLSSVNAPNNALTDISGITALAALTSAVVTDNPRIPCDQLDALQLKLGQNLLRSESCQP